jgi:hypothetical protein
MVSVPMRALLELVLFGDLEEIEKGLRAGALPSDQLVEALAGFMCERCDNMLANAEREDTRSKIFEFAEECRRFFLKAHARRRGLELEVFGASSAEELDERALERLRSLLRTGEYRLIVVPKEGYLFFKNYYPSKHDPEKLKATVARLERIVKALSESAVIRAAYGKELESLKRGLLKVKGFVDLCEFLAQREPQQLGEVAGAEHAKTVLEIARTLRRTAQECNRLADELEKTVALHA